MTKNNSKSFIVHKFGGSSLKDASSFHAVASRLSGNQELIVVSATHATTAALQQMLDRAKREQPFQELLQRLLEKHTEIVANLFVEPVALKFQQALEQDSQDISDLLHTTHFVKEYSPEIQAKVMGYGEIWSATILTTLLALKHNAVYLNAANVIVTCKKHGTLAIDWQRSEQAWGVYLEQQSFDQLVITGFLASDEAGKQVLLGRNGSDFSAAIFAKLAKARELVIWKDVDGVYSADPTRVRSAFAIPQLSYQSALELAYFGAKVIHPQTIAPAMELNIPIRIKNTLNPKVEGTLISSQIEHSPLPVQGLTSIDHVGLVNIEGAGLIGVSGTAARVFKLMHKHDISVVLISQASSEHSICFAVEKKDAANAVDVLVDNFEFEMQQSLVERIYVDKDCAILAAVGDGMVGKKGVSARLMSTLAKSDINIRAIAQGSSERNISVVLEHQDIDKALRAVHSGFYLSDKTISIGIIGLGVVGSALLQQINAELQRLKQQRQVNLRVRAICNSKTMLLAQDHIDLNDWQQQLAQSSTQTQLQKFAEHVIADDIPHAVIIDCTASQATADCYLSFMQKGLHVITPNKKANAGDYQNYQQLKSLALSNGRHFLYETTVCAGLPVMTTLNDILETGDEVIEIQGIVSGTLSYIFSQLATGALFSQIIIDAKNKGFTEPDPREDLSGMDVARKVVILARELGFAAKLDEVKVVNLVPTALQDCSVEEFLQRLPEFDEEISSQIAAKTGKDEVPVYLGSIAENATIAVGISSFPTTHPFAHLSGTDNMLIFKTQRYFEQPLVIQGPGAGAEVTAAGVFADLLRLTALITQ